MSSRWRSSSEGAAPRINPLARSRAESRVSIAPEVRCACQYFQSDSLLPDRINPIGSRPMSRNEMPTKVESRPSSRTEGLYYKTGKGIVMGDHEYEPIGEPLPQLNPEVLVTDSQEHTTSRRLSDASSTTSAERKFLRVPLETEGATNDDQEMQDGTTSAQDGQNDLEDRYFNGTPTTTESRTDCEINTSQVDSSGLEDLPLKRDSRKKGVTESSRNFQQKLRSQAGRLRTKLKNIKRPSFNMPDRPKFERPKFNMPDRPKFNMPERPKFNFPERPKFNMPERPKFKMPERPKINFPTMSMSLTRNKKPTREKAISSSESSAGTKKMFDFRTYPRIFDRSKKANVDYVTSSPKHERAGTPPPPEFATVPRVARKKGPVGARWVNRFSDIKYADEESKHSAQKLDSDEEDEEAYRDDLDHTGSLERRMKEDMEGRKRRDFEDRIMQVDEDYRQMQEYDKENQQIHELSRQKMEAIRNDAETKQWERGESDDREFSKEPNDSFQRQDSNVSEEYSGQPNEYWGTQPHITASEDTQNYNFDADVKYTPETNRDLTPLTNQEERSSGSSSARHRQGVLEEIDSDEFFLRQKGISQDNIEVGRYLSTEIRDAFRTPINALAQMDAFDGFYDRDIDLSEERINDNFNYRMSPERPTRSLRRKHKMEDVDLTQPVELSTENVQQSVDNEPPENGYYNTFPPSRPTRSRRSQKEKDDYDAEISPYNIINDSYDEIPPNDRNFEQNIDNFDRLMYENEMMEGRSQPEIMISNGDQNKRQYLQEQESAKRSSQQIDNQYENEENLKNILNLQEPPQPPKKKKKKKTAPPL